MQIEEEFKSIDQLIIGKGQGLTITHISNAFLNFAGSRTACIMLKDVLLVPSITENLLSISKITSINNVFVEFCDLFL